MTTFCVQVQLDRAHGLDVNCLRQTCEALAKNEADIEHFWFVEGADDGPYINLMFETSKPHALWKLIDQKLYKDACLGSSMRQSSIVMCTGESDWDDYLLLQHYDSTVKCDDPLTKRGDR